jgi:hypothetical protein
MFGSFARLDNGEHPRYVEPELNVPFLPITGRFSDKALFIHRGAICKMKLENVSTGFDVEAE